MYLNFIHLNDLAIKNTTKLESLFIISFILKQMNDFKT